MLILIVNVALNYIHRITHQSSCKVNVYEFVFGVLQYSYVAQNNLMIYCVLNSEYLIDTE